MAREITKLPSYKTEEIIRNISSAAAALRRVLPEAPVSNASVQPTPAKLALNVCDLRDAFQQVARMRDTLDGLNFDDSGEIATALMGYQRLLREFRAKLPCIRGWLLAEQARLSIRQSHSTAVEIWLQTSRQTR